MEGKTNTSSKDSHITNSNEAKHDSSKKGSNGDAHKIPDKHATEEKEISHYKDSKSHQAKEHKEVKAHLQDVKINDEKEKEHKKETALKASNKPSLKGNNKGLPHGSPQKTEKSKVDQKGSTKSTASNQAPEGFYYNENDEHMPAFMKKLAQNKNQNLINANQQEIKQQCLNCNEVAVVNINPKINFNTELSEENSDEHLDSEESEESENSTAVKEVRDLLKYNRDWVRQTLENNPQFLKEISAPQHPKYLIISCSDSRILTSKILGTHPGELFVHRNIGNIVLAADFNMQSVLSYAVENLKVKNIIVLGHTDCGAIKTSLSNKYHGLIDHWLKPIKDIVEKHHDLLDQVMKKNPEKLTTKLSELNVKEQVINICKNPIVQKAWNDRQELYIHGLLFDMETGFVRDLKTMKKEWKMIEDIHALEFPK